MNQYQYAVDSQGNPVYYKDAKKGETYYCIECGQEMLFCSGEQRTYFRHKNSVDEERYPHCFETYLHNTAKMLYAEKCKSGMLRVKIVQRCKDYNECLFRDEERDCTISESEVNLMDFCEFVGVEKYTGNYKADILLRTRDEGSPVLLEIWVTHKCTEQKIRDCKVFEVKIENEDDIDLKLPVMYVDGKDKRQGILEWNKVSVCFKDLNESDECKWFNDVKWFQDHRFCRSKDFKDNCKICYSMRGGECDRKWDCPGFRLAYSKYYPRQYRIN